MPWIEKRQFWSCSYILWKVVYRNTRRNRTIHEANIFWCSGHAIQLSFLQISIRFLLSPLELPTCLDSFLRLSWFIMNNFRTKLPRHKMNQFLPPSSQWSWDCVRCFPTSTTAISKAMNAMVTDISRCLKGHKNKLKQVTLFIFTKQHAYTPKQFLAFLPRFKHCNLF